MVTFKAKNTILVKASDSGRYGEVIAGFNSWEDFNATDYEVIGLYRDCGKDQKLHKLQTLKDAESAHSKGSTIIAFV